MNYSVHHFVIIIFLFHTSACPGRPGCLRDLQRGLRGLCCNGAGRGHSRGHGGTGDVKWKRLKMVEDMEDVVDLISVWCLDEDSFNVLFFFFWGGGGWGSITVWYYDSHQVYCLLVHVIMLFVGWLFNFGHYIYEAEQCLGLIKAADSWHVSTEVAVIWLRPTAVFLHWDFRSLIFAQNLA